MLHVLYIMKNISCPRKRIKNRKCHATSYGSQLSSTFLLFFLLSLYNPVSMLLKIDSAHVFVIFFNALWFSFIVNFRRMICGNKTHWLFFSIKLYDIKPIIRLSQTVVRNIRLEEVALARIRIGHTRITHSYLLNREEPPQFVGCDKPFTVRHILLEFVDFSNVRNKYHHGNTIKQLFNDVPIDNTILFLKEINLFNKL